MSIKSSDTKRMLDARERQKKAACEFGIPRNISLELLAGTSMEFMLIPPGEFLMGASEVDPDALTSEKPLHPVRISRPFYMAKYPCTQEQWQSVTGANPSFFTGCSRNPVENVDWNDIYETFLSRANSLAPDGFLLRLPTEAQWEYACKAGTNSRFSFGWNLTGKLANFNENRSHSSAFNEISELKTTPVGSFPSNGWGLHDMHGNVWEWCRDSFDDEYYRFSPNVDPENKGSGRSRSIRGGSCFYFEWTCRSSSRFGVPVGMKNIQWNCHDAFGFRVSIDLCEYLPYMC